METDKVLKDIEFIKRLKSNGLRISDEFTSE